MEYNPVTPCPLNQKVMAEKRKKLMETWDRLFLMYEKEVPDKYEELKKQWAEYQVSNWRRFWYFPTKYRSIDY